MSTVIEQRPTEDAEEQVPANGLFQVWIDLNEGEPPSDWWWNSKPQPLRDALQEAAETRAAGWVVAVYPEGKNPRPDGKWDNP